MKSVWDDLDSIDDHDLNGNAVDTIIDLKEKVDEIDESVKEVTKRIELYRQKLKERTIIEIEEFFISIKSDLDKIRTELY